MATPSQVSAFTGLTAPSRADPTNFAVRGDAWMAAFGTFQTQVNTVTNEINLNALAAAASALAAATSQSAAAASATSAGAAVVAALAVAGVVAWVAGTNYADGVAVYSRINYLTYRKRGAGISNVDPANDTANWAVLTGSQAVVLFTSGGTFTPEPGRLYLVEYCGGGGGGAGGRAINVTMSGGAAGGLRGAGGTLLRHVIRATSATPWNITIGANGIGGAGRSATTGSATLESFPGTAGSATTVGSFPPAAGGAGGSGPALTPTVGVAGAITAAPSGSDGIGPNNSVGTAGAVAGSNPGGIGGAAGGNPGSPGVATDDFFLFGSSGGAAGGVVGTGPASQVAGSPGASAGKGTGGTGGNGAFATASATSSSGADGRPGYARIFTLE